MKSHCQFDTYYIISRRISVKILSIIVAFLEDINFKNMKVVVFSFGIVSNNLTLHEYT